GSSPRDGPSSSTASTSSSSATGRWSSTGASSTGSACSLNWEWCHPWLTWMSRSTARCCRSAEPMTDNAELRERVQAIRAEIDHPVIDCDGHIVEFLPDLVPFLKRAGIESETHLRLLAAVAAWGRTFRGDWSKMSKEERARSRVARPSSNDFSSNPLDRATTMLPELMYQRLDEIGIDFALIYPSLGNFLSGLADEKQRRLSCPEFNESSMALFRPFADRLTIPAVIPMVTPEEAVEELEHAHSLGYKIALIPAYVRRYDDGAPRGLWFDSFSLDSLYDYDAVW